MADLEALNAHIQTRDQLINEADRMRQRISAAGQQIAKLLSASTGRTVRLTADYGYPQLRYDDGAGEWFGDSYRCEPLHVARGVLDEVSYLQGERTVDVHTDEILVPTVFGKPATLSNDVVGMTYTIPLAVLRSVEPLE